MKSVIIAQKVLKQIRRDRRFLVFSMAVPFIIIFLIKLFFNNIPPEVPRSRYVIPLAAFIAHLLSYVLSTISLVQERTKGTLDRVFISGADRWDVMLGYVMGYSVLGTLQSFITFFGTILLFNLKYSTEKIFSFFLIIWILTILSVMLGLLVSSFARTEAQVIPFIPLVIIPTAFFSGMIINFNTLPVWAKIIGFLSPFHYANDALLELTRGYVNMMNVWKSISVLITYAIFSIIVSSQTLREVE